jgi:exo-beta-1,3-glucanase (GH17 family)/cellulose synthase/poly-beta-1,6-N-acetylglucosamine synthase-like glycosyltransferase
MGTMPDIQALAVVFHESEASGRVRRNVLGCHTMSRSTIFADMLIVITFAVVTFSLWAYFNRPVPEPPWPNNIQGFSFSPFRSDQDGIARDYPSEQEIEEDLEQLSGKTYAVRTYSVDGPLGQIPVLADKYNINVALGVWIGDDKARNHQEVETAKRLAWTHRNIVRLIVGNEVLLRGNMPKEELFGHLDHLREAVWQPVSTAEPWHVWIKHPDLARHVDYITVHMLPYWEGVHVDRAVGYIFDKIDLLQQTFPGMPIVIGEVGWPSNGRTRKSAVASTANEALFLRRFLKEADQQRRIYYVMEAFDQPWKAAAEGSVGAYWGVYDVHRQPKFPFTAPVVRIPHWKVLASLSVVVALIIFSLLLFDRRALRRGGRSFLAIVAFAAATTAVWVVNDYSRQYLSPYILLVGLLLFLGMIGVMLMLLAEAHEWAEAHWARYRTRLFIPQEAIPFVPPKVSVHLPAYNEPPDMVIKTLNALAALDYPDFEVIVIDNNTQDPGIWQPVEAHCRELGPRFRFFHVNPLEGFKAGALNYALGRTAPDAQVVAVIDSDYQVSSDWLKDLVSLFVKPRIAVVQAPQDYRDGDVNTFKAMMHAEYRGFFYIGMITRNERNAIIQHGTMTLVRRQVLEDIGGWAEWCITEDAELGLRIFERGFEAVYVSRSYGKGLMPDTLADFKKQRFRWAFGAIQIMRRHRSALLGRSGLSGGQRYHFVAGWLPWLADGFNLVFNFAALAWSTAMVWMPRKVDPPLIMFVALPMALFCFKMIKLIHLYTTRVGASPRQTMAAALAGLALTHVIGRAMLTGLFRKDRAFFRTPKMAATQPLTNALSAAREEVLFMLALWLASFAVLRCTTMNSPDAYLWVIMLLVQSVPYTASTLVALISGFPKMPAWLVGRSTSIEATVQKILEGTRFGHADGKTDNDRPIDKDKIT